MPDLTVKLTFPSDWPIERQTPGGDARWGRCRFVINEEPDSCDLWVVYHDLERPESTVAASTLLVTGEPPSIHHYPGRFCAQFDRVVSCGGAIRHPGLVQRQQGLPWHIGRRVHDSGLDTFSRDFDELVSNEPPDKSRLLSVIVSAKDFTPGHRKRLRFLDALQDHFGDRLDVFGRGIRDIPDKWEALAPYRFHIVLENSVSPDYWTEKLSDALLAWCHPIYHGCPNIADYFDPRSVTRIDLDDSHDALAKIEQTIARVDEADHLERVRAARQRVLYDYNLFNVIADLAPGPGSNEPVQGPPTVLSPQARFRAGPLRRAKQKLSLIGRSVRSSRPGR